MEEGDRGETERHTGREMEGEVAYRAKGEKRERREAGSKRSNTKTCFSSPSVTLRKTHPS